MVVVTLAVSVLPILAVSALRSEGMIDGIIPLIGAGLGISFAITMVGSALWKATPGSGDMLFGDLIVWGFVRRWRVDRRMSNAAGLLGMRGGRVASDLSLERKAELLEELGDSLEARDPYTHGHSRRVARHSAMMAKRLGLSREEVARIRTAAAIHDIGKVETPKAVLGKPGRLTDKEFDAIKRHPVDGARMAAALRDPKLTEMVLHHHERLDGGGYPQGLVGDVIPLGARIIAVADTFDAITSARPYRPAKAHKKALEVLRAESGTQLDSEAVEAFRGYYSGLRPVAIWAVLVSIPQRLFNGLFDELGASVVSASKMAAATTASVIAGAAAVHAVGTGAQPAGEADHGQAESLAFVPGSDVVLAFGAFPPRPGAESVKQGAPKFPRGHAGAGSVLKGTKGVNSPRWTEAHAPANAGSTGSAGSGGGREAGGPGRPPGADPGTGDVPPDREPERATGQHQSASDDDPHKPEASGDAGTDQPGPTAALPESGKSKSGKGKSGEHPTTGKGNSGEHPTTGKGSSGEHPSSDKGNSGDSPSSDKGGSAGSQGGGDPQGGGPATGAGAQTGLPAATPSPGGPSPGGGSSSAGGSPGGGPPASPGNSSSTPSGGQGKPH